MKISLCYLIAATGLVLGCSNSKLYSKFEKQQNLALVSYFSSENTNVISIKSKVSFDKSRSTKTVSEGLGNNTSEFK